MDLPSLILFFVSQTCLLLDGLFPLVSELLREKLDCHYYVFQGALICRRIVHYKCISFITACIFYRIDVLQFLIAVFILWLKSVKECLPEIREISGAPFLGEGSILRDKLTQIIWDNAESPVRLVCVDLLYKQRSIYCICIYIHVCIYIAITKAINITWLYQISPCSSYFIILCTGRGCVGISTHCLQFVSGDLWAGLSAFWRYWERALCGCTAQDCWAAVGVQGQILTTQCTSAVRGYRQGNTGVMGCASVWALCNHHFIMIVTSCCVSGRLYVFLSVCLSVSLTICVCVCLSIYSCICLIIFSSVRLSECLSACLGFFWLVCQCVSHMSVCLSVSVCMSVYLTISPTVSLSINLFVYLSVCLSVFKVSSFGKN